MRPCKLNKTVVGVFVASFLALMLSAESAIALTAEWSQVAMTCVPDDADTTPNRYDINAGGLIKFKGTATGNLFFWCNVLSPRDSFGTNPDWNTLFVTHKDSNAQGFVQVKLIRKRKDNGGTGENAVFTSSDGVGVRERSVSPIPAFNFATYAYFLRIQLYRSTTAGDPEIHIVTLGYTLE